MTADEAITTDIGSKTFRLVRKGYDPHEVRRYLSKLAEEILVLQTKAEAPPAPETDAGVDSAASSPSEASVSTSEGTDAAASVDSSPYGPASIGASAEPAAEPAAPVADVADEVDAAPAAGADQTVGSDESAGVDEIVPALSDAPAAAAGGGPAEGDRWAQMGQHVASVLAAADREAAAIKAGAEQHAARRLAALDGELEASRTALRELRRQLTEVHTLVSRSLGELSEAEHPS